jgi:hypothetical protein
LISTSRLSVCSLAVNKRSKSVPTARINPADPWGRLFDGESRHQAADGGSILKIGTRVGISPGGSIRPRHLEKPLQAGEIVAFWRHSVSIAFVWKIGK